MQFKYWLQRQVSRFVPVTLHVFDSTYSGELQVVWYKLQMCLATKNAFYSYGIKYAPFRISFQYLKEINKLPKLNGQFLMLGGAMCSAQQILHYQYQLSMHHTVVEIDNEIIEVAKTFLPLEVTAPINFIHDDAFEFIFKTDKLYDVIAVDIFNDLTIPPHFCETIFLNQCKSRLAANGIFIMNTHFLDNSDKEKFRQALHSVFPNATIIPYQKNEIILVC